MTQSKEMNGVLVLRADGWRIQWVEDDGTTWEQDQPPFSTREEAQAVMDKVVAELELHHGAISMRPN